MQNVKFAQASKCYFVLCKEVANILLRGLKGLFASFMKGFACGSSY
jgi:hypothetical protein